MSKLLLDAHEIDKSLSRIAHEIIEQHKELPDLIGIRTCGEFLVRRLVAKIKEFSGSRPNVGILDINLYRDDLTRVSEQPVIRETVIDFTVDDRAILLVDDVLFTGRTARCALDALMDYGRPKKIQLAVLVDRGHRELPIKADYVGKNVPTTLQEIVHVRMKEKDGKDEVVLERKSS
jgi:pyrimidine operon attenuation protein / uracil phosphoribosyltransferase